ncbi:MAG: hypothetical protein OXI60_10655 [Acidiferrobacterales bacterium]|nr:hypothetical protein [Acidiferrobacterales bacterium]
MKSLFDQFVMITDATRGVGPNFAESYAVAGLRVAVKLESAGQEVRSASHRATQL